MLKKLSVILVLFFTLFGFNYSVNAEGESGTGGLTQEQIDTRQQIIQDSKTEYTDAKKTSLKDKSTARKYNNTADEAQKKADEAQSAVDNYEPTDGDNLQVVALEEKAQELQKEADIAKVQADKFNNIYNESNSITQEKEKEYYQTLVNNATDIKQEKEGSEGLAKITNREAVEAQQKANEAQELADATNDVANQTMTEEDLAAAKEAQQKADDLQESADRKKTEADNANNRAENDAKAYADSPLSDGDITNRGFTIHVDGLTPGMTVKDKGSSVEERVNYLLATIIQRMMIFLGSAALFIMTVGAGYIIMHHGQDELLSKGKSIFMAGVYALLVALSSYYIVAIVRYILYQGNTGT